MFVFCDNCPSVRQLLINSAWSYQHHADFLMWLIMLMGLQNSPAVHQWCVCSALWSLIGKICHVYLDDIIIWSDSLAQHKENVALILEALHAAHLYCSVKKSILFSHKVDFLGHHISKQGIELDPKKVEC